MGNVFSQVFPTLWSIKFRSKDSEAYKKTARNGIFIALVGRSGSGMSRLIHDATGSYETAVSPEDHIDPEPYTISIQDFGFTVPGINFSDFPLFFIDTPGFDYSNNNNEHTALQNLRSWIRYFKTHTQLDGLVFMHNVYTDELRMRAPFFPRQQVIEELCGTKWAEKVVFVSSHWGKIKQEEKEQKEGEIKNYWKRMIEKKSRMEKYDDPSLKCAWGVLKPLVMDAQAAREQRLKEELGNLESILAADAYSRISEFLDRKAEFIRGVIKRLGDEGFGMTEAEEHTYEGLNQEAASLWKEVEKELNVTELERWLTSGKNQEECED